MGKLEVRLDDAAGTAEDLPLRVFVHEPGLLGHAAELVVELKARVKDKRPVHASRELFRHAFTLQQTAMHVALPRQALAGCYSYTGKQLDVLLVLRIKVDDGVLFDTEVECEHPLPLGDRPRQARGDPKLIDPADAFRLLANLAALPARNRLIAIGLLLFGGLIALGNLAIGTHDQFVPESQTLFYDHRGSDGDESPLVKALMGSGALGAAVWAALLAQLRRYMRFALKPHPPLRRGSRIRLSDLVEGESRVPLKGICLRVVAANRERGQYRRKGKKEDRTVSFTTAVSAVLLYERRFNLIPAGMPLATYLDDEVDFTPMFADLLPPLAIGSSHGIDVVWEVQLLHPDYVDHELIGDSKALRYEDFLDD